MADLAALIAASVRPKRRRLEEWESRVLRDASVTALPSGAVGLSWGSGPPILLVHGWEGAGTQFAEFVGPIVGSGRRAIAVDGPAHGASDVQEFTPAAFARSLMGVQERFGPMEGVVAHSLGSAALAGALRDGLSAGSIALLAPVLSFSTELSELPGQFGVSGAVAAEFAQRIRQVIGRPPADLDLGTYPIGDIPVLVHHDVEDRKIPIASTRRLAAVWPAAKIVETSGLGHRRMLRDPATVSAVIGHVVSGYRPGGTRR